jgi:hypothetical protein
MPIKPLIFHAFCSTTAATPFISFWYYHDITFS